MKEWTDIGDEKENFSTLESTPQISSNPRKKPAPLRSYKRYLRGDFSNDQEESEKEYRAVSGDKIKLESSSSCTAIV